MTSILKPAILFSCILLLVGCQIGVDVKIVQLPDGRIRIDATRRDGEPICVREVIISHSARPRRDGAYVNWALRKAPLGPCVGSFTYPEIPQGYEIDNGYERDPDAATLALEPGVEYFATVSGSGFSAGDTFIRTTGH